MQNNFIILCLFLILMGCSSKNELDQSDYKNIFQDKNVLPLTEESGRLNSKIDQAKNLNNIFNAKSYNITNPFVDYPLEKIWEIKTDQDVNDENPFLSEPIVISSHLYLINNNGVVFKINIDNGKIVWKKDIFNDLENTIVGTPSISGALSNQDEITIYINSGYNQILAMNGNNGDIIWKKTHNLPFRGGMTVSKDVLLISDFAGNFLSINNKNGYTNWNVLLGSDYNSVYTKARPIVAKNKIIVPGTGGSFYVISVETGDVFWTENMSSNKQLPKLFHAGDIVANPIYKNGVIYLVSQSGNISAFDIDTSEELWNLPIGGFDTPSISGETIFISGNMGLLAAIDIVTGKVRWTKKFPSYVNANLFFSEKEIALYKGPTLINSKILFGDNDGTIHIIDPNTGSDIGELSIGKLAIPPIPAHKKVFFLTENGTLLAYK
ncbi:PQQ-binding-like beta-propeller repeat protein [Alphaproteobacteria bacterium]|nr:PQQ-binding-like beta-propeller repeat protein [Alphaproteobacteria bacterium]